MQHARPRVGEVKALLGPSNADVGEAPLFFELIGLTDRTHVREDPFFHAHQENHGKFETLGRVQSHQDDIGLVVVDLVGVGNQAHLLEELIDGFEAASEADELG